MSMHALADANAYYIKLVPTYGQHCAARPSEYVRLEVHRDIVNCPYV